MTPFELNLQNELSIEQQRFANKWLFIWHNINMPDRVVDVEDFRGGRIYLGGILFQGQQQKIYWQAISRYLFAQIHDTFRKWNDETISYPARARQSSLDGVQQLLSQFITATIQSAAETDRRLRGKGFPDRVPVYNSSLEQTGAIAEVLRLVGAHRKLSEGEMDFLAAFADRVDRRLNEMAKDTYRECQAIVAEMAARGLATSGPRVQKQLDAIQNQVQRAIDWALLEANDLPGQKNITRGLVRPMLGSRLGAHADQLYTIVNLIGMIGNVGNAVSEHHLSVKRTLSGELNDFEQGIWKPRGSVSSGVQMTTNNTVNIHESTVGSVQQAGVSSRAETHKTHHTIAATRQTEARKFLASLS